MPKHYIQNPFNGKRAEISGEALIAIEAIISLLQGEIEDLEKKNKIEELQRERDEAYLIEQTNIIDNGES